MNYTFCLIVIAALLFSGCATTKKSIPENSISDMSTLPLTGKKWKLIEIGGNPVAEKINNKTPFIEFHSGAESRYSASGGCNGLGGTYTATDNGKIKFSQGMSTLMACADMSVENQLKKLLGIADNYTISGNILSLNKARAAPLARFELVAQDLNASLNGQWELNYISGPRIAFDGLYPDKKPIITFNLPDTVATGNSSCNNFRVSFDLQDQKIKFGMPMSTKMACGGQGEATFFKTLQTIDRFSVSDNTLTLIMGDIAVMRFNKKD